ncbi:hypothetical protein SeLEV6574_g07233 [Synchytrium endobioticum]|uniref:IC97/Casc1 N-terminal domain-containing protein n=1 Tax=Synchytrium endobioticum TaxID=286115 RepID=A0A507CIN2_9FUNG|nr:hypothetical protein SeLEV6574_g07233 [Synchytrium endobioticum]
MAETTFSTQDPSFDELIPIINEAEKLCDDLDAAIHTSLTLDKKERQRLTDQLINLRMTMHLQLESASARILQYMDQLVEDTTENFVTSRSFGCFKLGLWANLTKNPRHKALEFTNEGINIALPKALVLTGVGIRLLHETGPTATCQFRDASKPFMSIVGGILHLDLVELPEWPANSTKWVIRKILSPNYQGLRRISYPFPIDPAEASVDGEDADVDLIITLKLPFTVPNATLMNWDAETNSWTSDGIRDVVFEPEQGQVKFRTCYFRPTAVVQTAPSEFPLSSWTMRPCSNGVRVDIVGKQDTIQIEVSEQYCSVWKPESLSSYRMPPSLLLKNLAHVGMNFIGPREVTRLDLQDITLKNPIAEEACILGITFMAAGLQFRSSSINKKIATSKITFQVRTPDNTADEETGWTHVLFDAQYRLGDAYKKVCITASDVTEETKVVADDSSPQIHATAVHALKEILKSAGAAEPSPAVADSLHELLTITRLLCFT